MTCGNHFQQEQIVILLRQADRVWRSTARRVRISALTKVLDSGLEPGLCQMGIIAGLGMRHGTARFRGRWRWHKGLKWVHTVEVATPVRRRTISK
jgi:hypothetical protein